MGQGVLMEYLVNCAFIATPVKIDRGIGELDHSNGYEGIDMRYQYEKK